MNDWKKIAVSPDTVVIEAMKIIDKLGSQFVVVVDNNDFLLGSLSDGDIRRALLQNIPLTVSVKEVMNKMPLSLPHGTSRRQTKAFLAKNKISHVPLVGPDGRVFQVVNVEDVQAPFEKKNTVVLMLGGLGSRL